MIFRPKFLVSVFKIRNQWIQIQWIFIADVIFSLVKFILFVFDINFYILPSFFRFCCVGGWVEKEPMEKRSNRFIYSRRDPRANSWFTELLSTLVIIGENVVKNGFIVPRGNHRWQVSVQDVVRYTSHFYCH